MTLDEANIIVGIPDYYTFGYGQGVCFGTTHTWLIDPERMSEWALQRLYDRCCHGKRK